MRSVALKVLSHPDEVSTAALQIYWAKHRADSPFQPFQQANRSGEQRPLEWFVLNFAKTYYKQNRKVCLYCKSHRSNRSQSIGRNLGLNKEC